jgi:hypothetical protein
LINRVAIEAISFAKCFNCQFANKPSYNFCGYCRIENPLISLSRLTKPSDALSAFLRELLPATYTGHCSIADCNTDRKLDSTTKPLNNNCSNHDTAQLVAPRGSSAVPPDTHVPESTTPCPALLSLPRDSYSPTKTNGASSTMQQAQQNPDPNGPPPVRTPRDTSLVHLHMHLRALLLQQQNLTLKCPSCLQDYKVDDVSSATRNEHVMTAESIPNGVASNNNSNSNDIAAPSVTTLEKDSAIGTAREGISTTAANSTTDANATATEPLPIDIPTPIETTTTTTVFNSVIAAEEPTPHVPEKTELQQASPVSVAVSEDPLESALATLGNLKKQQLHEREQKRRSELRVVNLVTEFETTR